MSKDATRHPQPTPTCVKIQKNATSLGEKNKLVALSRRQRHCILWLWEIFGCHVILNEKATMGNAGSVDIPGGGTEGYHVLRVKVSAPGCP